MRTFQHFVALACAISVAHATFDYVQQGEKLVVDGFVKGAHGTSVALSSRGTLLAVGGPEAFVEAKIGGANTRIRTGVVSLFEPTGPDEWTKTPEPLVGEGVVASMQGESLAFAGDGTILATAGDNKGLNNKEIPLWAFQRPRFGDWTEQKVSKAHIATCCGRSVALSEDGSVMAVAGSAREPVAATSRKLLAFESYGTWLFQKSSTGAYERIAEFALGGESVSLSADGNMLAVAGCGLQADAACVAVFERSQEGDWIRKLRQPFDDDKATSVKLSGDKKILAVADYRYNNEMGITRVYERESVNGDWVPVDDRLFGTGAQGGRVRQGSSLALDFNGNILAVGGMGDNNGVGAVWVFGRSLTGEYVQREKKLVGSKGIGAQNQGKSVALSSDGRVLAVGAPGDDARGAVWMYKTEGLPPSNPDSGVDKSVFEVTVNPAVGFSVGSGHIWGFLAVLAVLAGVF